MISEYKTYANFNSVSITAGVVNVRIVPGQYGEFADITLISNLTDGDESAISIQFTDSKELLLKAKSENWFVKGRKVTLVGHISSISEYYEDEATGELLPRKRPLVTLTDVHVPDGGWGTIPKGDSQTISKTKRTLRPVAPAVDKTPVAV